MISPARGSAQKPDGSPGSPSDREADLAPVVGRLPSGSPGGAWPIRWPPLDPPPPEGAGRRGFPALTLIEIVIVGAIVATAAGLALPAYWRYRDNARNTQAIADIRIMDQDIAVEESSRGKLPDSLADVGRGSFLDPWGRPYQYLLTPGGIGGSRRDKLAKPLNTDYDLYSMGKDGVTSQRLDTPQGMDDIVRGLNGAFVGLASDF